MLQPPGASVVAADAAVAARTIHRHCFFFFLPPPLRFQAFFSPVGTLVSGCAVVAVEGNTQAPRTARHRRRHSGRGRQWQSGIAGRRQDAMRETPTTFYACAHARWLKAHYYIMIIF